MDWFWGFEDKGCFWVIVMIVVYVVIFDVFVLEGFVDLFGF